MGTASQVRSPGLQIRDLCDNRISQIYSSSAMKVADKSPSRSGSAIPTQSSPLHKVASFPLAPNLSFSLIWVLSFAVRLTSCY